MGQAHDRHAREQMNEAHGHPARPTPAVEQPWGNAAAQDAAQDAVGSGAGGVPTGAVAWTDGMADIPDAGATGTSVPPRPQTQDATRREHNAIQGAVDEARRMAGAGLGVLSQCSPENEGLLLQWFKASDPALLTHPTGVMRATRDGLSSDFTVQVEGSRFPWPLMDQEAAAYVYNTSGTDIHVVPEFFTLSPARQAQALVHEASHKWGRTTDVEYFAQARSSDIRHEDAIVNADTYAWFASEALAGAGMALDRRDTLLEREAAVSAMDALWGAVLADEAILRDGWTTADGVPISAAIVQDVVIEHFLQHHPEDYSEVMEAYGAGTTSGPLHCRSGFVISSGLFDLLYEHAVATNP